MNPSQDLPENLAKAAFLLFVYIADTGDGLTARDVEQMKAWISKPPASSSPTMQAAWGLLPKKYAELWRAYQRNPNWRSLESIYGLLMQLRPSCDAAEISAIETDLISFLEKLWFERPLHDRSGFNTMSNAKRKAYGEAAQLLADWENGRAPTLTPAAPGHAEPVQADARNHASDFPLWPAAQLALAAENVWQRGRTRVRCAAVIHEAHDVKTFVFEPIPAKLCVFKPGQFVTLELAIENKTVRRSYTISSSPSRPHLISITVKRVEGGLVSNWLLDNMRADFEFTLNGPHGSFNCFDAPADRILLISAGSGVTPTMSMLRWLVDTHSQCDIVFINNVRSPQDIIFAKELDYLASRASERIKLGIVPSKIPSSQSWSGPSGRFSLEILQHYAPDFLTREVFVCGPVSYMSTVRDILEKAGFPMAHYHQESFGEAPAKPRAEEAAAPASRPSAPKPVVQPTTSEPSAPTGAAAAEVELVFSKSGKTLKCLSNDFILDIAELNDVHMETSCRTGTCGTCKVKKTEGEVVMEDQQALTDDELSEGYVLACIGRACGGKVVLDA